MESYSLYELNEYIKRVIALNFSESIWIKAEISQVKESRGQLYIDLVEKDENTDQITAQASAIVWYKSHLFIKKKLGELADSILQDGSEVSLKVSIAFHERYGLKLNIEDIDPSYTLGQLEINRQKILSRLEKDGLQYLNEERSLPIVLQRIAVISSATAAGYKDFKAQLEENPYGYKFHSTLFNIAVQGRAVSSEFCKAMESINAKNFDLVIVIRGGGSKIDLSGFDDYNIGAKIAKCKIPVITGIGHEIDNTIADLMAHTSLKTPTAVADFIIEHNGQFEVIINELGQNISNAVNEKLFQSKLELNHLEQRLELVPNEILKTNSSLVDHLEEQLWSTYQFAHSKINSELISTERIIQSLNPTNILKRGFIYATQNSTFVTNAASLKKDDKIELTFIDGTKKAIINE